MYERVIESLTQTIHSNTLVHTGIKHVWASHWITHSNDSFKHIGSYRKKTFMSESLNHSLKRFIQTHWFIQEENMSESLNHSLKRFIQTHWFIQEENMSESLNHSLKRFIQSHWFIQEENMYERVIESLTQTIHSNTLVHTGRKHVWASHWITHSNDSFKHIGSYRNKTCMSESLNHSLKRFIQTEVFKFTSTEVWIVELIWFVEVWSLLSYLICLQDGKMADSALWLVRTPVNQALYEWSVHWLSCCLIFFLWKMWIFFRILWWQFKITAFIWNRSLL